MMGDRLLTMCGIVGVFPKGLDVAADRHSEKAEKMLSRISHRGFLALKNVESFNTFSLGCVRLPIVDEAKGNQPCHSLTGRIALVFNGEIYNYLSLRERYLSGKQLKTESDTEVLANLIEVCGIETALSNIEGMFAFIAYDFQDARFYVGRDFIGIKPVYISERDSDISIASEMKAFDNTDGEIKEIPPQHYYDSLTGNHKWETLTSTSYPDLRTLISTSVKEQVNTDLPIAVFLSGGIDSSVICYEANRHHPDVTAFSIGKKNSNDMIIAERLCSDFNYKFEPVYVDEDELLNCIEDTVFSIESFEPNHVRAGTLTYLISKHVASKGFRVALCGEGADELFCGYPDFIELLKKNNNDYSELKKVLDSFIEGLYLTQLKRVDRAAMRFSLEVRPPFLSTQIVSYANSIRPEEKLVYNDGEYITKKPLREAYRGVLPAYVVDRIKSVFSEGAGFDTNAHHGPFWDYTKDKVSQSEITSLQNEYPEYFLKTHEEVYYFKIFLKHFDVHQIKPKRLLMSSL